MALSQTVDARLQLLKLQRIGFLGDLFVSQIHALIVAQVAHSEVGWCGKNQDLPVPPLKSVAWSKAESTKHSPADSRLEVTVSPSPVENSISENKLGSLMLSKICLILLLQMHHSPGM